MYTFKGEIETNKMSVHNEDQCTFVSTCGLSLICDHRPTYHGRQVEYGWNFNNQPGDIVFVKSTHLTTLLQYIPNFKYPIIIVANGDDNFFPSDFQSHPSFQQLHNSNVIALFIQNCWLRNHEKFHGIPIGIDYHTLNWEKEYAWGEAQRTALQQEAELKTVRQSFKHLAETSATVITNFHLAMHDPPRRRVMRVPLYEKLMAQHPAWMKWLPQQTRATFWQECNDVAFVLCPPGNGPDTHRAWEVLCLGRIPIIQDLSINDIYDDLPVWVVKDWDTFVKQTPEQLQAKRDEFVANFHTYNFEKLTLKWWKRYIYSFKPKLN